MRRFILDIIGSLALSRLKGLRRIEKEKSVFLKKKLAESKKTILDLNKEVEESRRRDSK